MDKPTPEKEPDTQLRRFCVFQGKTRYKLERFGDYLAKREGYELLHGLDALHYYLIQKHHWLPSQVKALNVDDLEFLFSEEQNAWTLPEDERDGDR